MPFKTCLSKMQKWNIMNKSIIHYLCMQVHCACSHTYKDRYDSALCWKRWRAPLYFYCTSPFNLPCCDLYHICSLSRIKKRSEGLTRHPELPRHYVNFQMWFLWHWSLETKLPLPIGSVTEYLDTACLKLERSRNLNIVQCSRKSCLFTTTACKSFL